MSYVLTLLDTASGGESCDFISGENYEWRKGGLWLPPPSLRRGAELLAVDPENRYDPREIRLTFMTKGDEGAELLSNTGFETPGGGGADIWADWDEIIGGDGTLTNEGTIVHSGNDACKIHRGVDTDTTRAQQDAAAVIPGKQYRLSFWARGSGSGEGRYGIYDVTNTAWIQGATDTGVSDTTWTEVIDYFVAPAGCVLVKIQLYCSNTASDDVYFDDASVVEVDDQNILWQHVERINRLLRLAQQQTENMDPPTVELQWKSDTATNTVYFIVLGGSLDLGPLEHVQIAVNKIVDCSLVLECMPFARGVSLGGSPIAVPLDNSSAGDKATTAIVVYNHDDASTGHDNYVDIEAADIKGDQPAEILLEAKNNAGSPNDLFRFHIAKRVRGTPSSFIMSLNAEDGVLQTDAAFADDATCPGVGGGGGVGQKVVCNFAGDATWAARHRFQIGATDVVRYGGWCILYAGLRATAGSEGDITAGIISAIYSTAYGSRVANSVVIDVPVDAAKWPLLDMGLIHIPPEAIGSEESGVVRIWIYAARTAGAGNLEVSQILLVPVESPDQYILGTLAGVGVLSVTSSDIGQGEIIRYRQYSDRRSPGLFGCSATPRERMMLDARGGVLLLEPNRNHRLFFAMANTVESDGSIPRYDILDMLDVQLWHIPRFLHVRGA